MQRYLALALQPGNTVDQPSCSRLPLAPGHLQTLRLWVCAAPNSATRAWRISSRRPTILALGRRQPLVNQELLTIEQKAALMAMNVGRLVQREATSRRQERLRFPVWLKIHGAAW